HDTPLIRNGSRRPKPRRTGRPPYASRSQSLFAWGARTSNDGFDGSNPFQFHPWLPAPAMIRRIGVAGAVEEGRPVLDRGRSVALTCSETSVWEHGRAAVGALGFRAGADRLPECFDHRGQPPAEPWTGHGP